uniref:Doublecortin-like kinase 3 n=1 Tax=Gouania willdenowi TaxID=441366 RepID=A0A8C5EH92_GOUWI
MEELFPDHLNYRAEALLAWERRLRTPPGKAPKADSGYSEGADSNGVNPNTQQDSKKDVKNQRNTMSSLHADKHKTGNNDFQKVVKRDSSRKLAHLPNHLQRDEDKRILKPVQDLVKVHKEEKKVNIEPSLDSNDVTMSEIERCYQIGRVVGDGNFAVVRECHRRDNGQMLAIKIVERSKLIGREHMMQNELSLLGSLSHPRIVRLLAHHHTHTHSYLVMELVRGGDLFEAISERGKFSEAAAGMMVSDVSEALDYIHCRSIVHRDLKPENLLVVSFDICRLKLGDFGLAMVVSEPVFTICGTPTYVAPEILCEIGYGIAVDVWALGVILYILLCGFPPFRSRDRDQEELFKLIKQAQFHFPSQDWDSITEAKSLVRALLQPDPTVRLTAKQTLQHPWVRAMTASCRQGALIDRNPWNSTDTGDQREELGKTTETQPAEIFVEKSSGHMLGGRNAVIPNKPSKHKERLSKTPGETGPENKPTQLPVKETNRRIPPQCTSLDSTPCQHKHNYTKRH